MQSQISLFPALEEIGSAGIQATSPELTTPFALSALSSIRFALVEIFPYLLYVRMARDRRD